MTIEQTFKKLQHVARERSSLDKTRQLTWKLPIDLATADAEVVVLGRAECDLVDQVVAELASDLRFEHLMDAQNPVLRFVAEASIHRGANHVPAFVKQYARPVEERNVIFTVLHLEIQERLEFGGATLLPPDDDLVPDEPELRNVPGCVGYLLVPCRGTNYDLMAARARQFAQRALGLLRTGMQMQAMYHRRQLRFRLGDTYVFASKQLGWQQREDIPYTAPLNREMFDRIIEKHVMRVPADNQKKGLLKQAQLALDWINRSLMVSEPLIAMLYQFFALEAMLGDPAEGLKSYSLAFRRTMIGHLVDGGWPAPESIYHQYEEIRSAAVHGSEATAVSPKSASLFESDVVRTLEQYLTFAADNRFTTRAQVRQALDENEDVENVLEHLRARDPKWEGFVPTSK